MIKEHGKKKARRGEPLHCLEDRAPMTGHGYVVNNHGDGNKSPKDRVVRPFINGRTLWLINGGDVTNHLQVLG